MINSRAAANYNLKGITEATSVITHFDNVNFLQCKGYPTDLSHLVTPACVTKQQLGLGITRQLNARRDFSLSSNRIESERKERTEADGEYLSDDGGVRLAVTLRLARAFSAVRWSSPMERNDSSCGGGDAAAADSLPPSLAVAIFPGFAAQLRRGERARRRSVGGVRGAWVQQTFRRDVGPV